MNYLSMLWEVIKQYLILNSIKQEGRVFLEKGNKQKRKKEQLEIVEKLMFENDACFRNLGEIITELGNQGFHIAKATLARYLKELSFVKDKGGYIHRPPEDVEEQERRYRKEKFLRSNIIGSYTNYELLLIKTAFGTEKGVASKLRSLFPKLILGTVSGDNLVIIFTKKEGNVSELKTEIDGIKKSKKEENRHFSAVSTSPSELVETSESKD